MMKNFSFAFTIGWSLLAFLSGIAQAEVPNHLEPVFSEAVLSYNNKAYDRAIQQVDELLKTNPNILEFWELKALSLKASKKEAGSIEVYTQLIDHSKAAGKPPKEMAPYHFELGVIQFRENKYREAIPHLVEAARWSFNVAPARFFLGTIAFKTSQWASAAQNFSAVTKSDVDALRPAAYFYLGQVALKTDYSSGAIESFYDARKQSQDQLADPKTSDETKKAAQQIFDATTKVLQPYENSQFFGNVALISSYDSNVLSVPSTEISSIPTGASSPKETIQLGFGYASAPLGNIQYVPSYKGGFNYDFNSATRLGEFMTHDASVYITKDALGRTSYGMKLEGIYTLQAQYDPNSVNNSTALRGYNLGGSFGPYFRREISRNLQFTAEAFFQPQKNFLDEQLSNPLKRSGSQGVAHLGIKNDVGSRFWNPGVTMNGDLFHTAGTEYRYKAVGFTLSDKLRFSDPFLAELSADVNHVNYADRPEGSRVDTILTFGLNGTYKWKKQYSFLGDIQYIHNGSTITDVYQFNRFVVSLGLSYSIL